MLDGGSVGHILEEQHTSLLLTDATGERSL
jgi:hypothetical protein